MGCALISASSCAGANPVQLGFQWMGDGGYSAEGVFTYDDSVLGTPDPFVYGYGSGPTHGLLDLTVSFFDPSHGLLYSVVDVVPDGTGTGGVSLYDFLSFTFNPVAQMIVGDSNGLFNVGLDSLPSSLYLTGSIGGPSYLFNFDTDTIDSVADGTMVQVIPEPSSLALFAIGLAGLNCRLRRKPA